MGTFDKVINYMRVLIEDSTTPRTVRDKVGQMANYLQQSKDDEQTKISNVLSQLEDISSDVNIPPFVRTQIYSISSQLESIGNQ